MMLRQMSHLSQLSTDELHLDPPDVALEKLKNKSFASLYQCEEYMRQQKTSLSVKVAALEHHKARFRDPRFKAIPSTPYTQMPQEVTKFKRTGRIVRKLRWLKSKLLSPLDHTIQSVERNLGFGVASYFKFARWLLVNNLVVFFFVLLPFVLAPHAVMVTKNVSANRTEAPCELGNFSAVDILAAENSMSLAFYGCFQSKVDGFGYKLQYAYLIAAIAFFVYWLLVISAKLLRSLTDTFIKSRLTVKKPTFSLQLFLAWPFNFTSEKYRDKKHNQIKIGLIEQLNAVRKPSGQPVSLQRVLFLVATNLVFFVVVGGVQVGVYYLINDQFVKTLDSKSRRIFLAGFICAVNYLSPILCNLFSAIERVQGSSKLLIKLARLVLIQFSSLIFAIILFINARDPCWETEIGQAIYSIAVFDLIVFFLDILISFTTLGLQKLFRPDGTLKFNIAYYTINALFTQTIVWFGTYYSPFLVVLLLVKLLLTLTVTPVVVKAIYKMPSGKWPTSRNNTYFMIITTAIFLVIFVASIFINTEVEASTSCGPLDDAKYKTPYEYLSIKIKERIMKVYILGFIFRLILSPGFMAFLLFLLTVLFYSSVTIMLGHKKSVNMLKGQLIQKEESRDSLAKKKYDLYNQLNKILGKEVNVDDEIEEAEKMAEEATSAALALSNATDEELWAMAQSLAALKRNTPEDLDEIVVVPSDKKQAQEEDEDEEDEEEEEQKPAPKKKSRKSKSKKERHRKKSEKAVEAEPESQATDKRASTNSLRLDLLEASQPVANDAMKAKIQARRPRTKPSRAAAPAAPVEAKEEPKEAVVEKRSSSVKRRSSSSSKAAASEELELRELPKRTNSKVEVVDETKSRRKESLEASASKEDAQTKPRSRKHRHVRKPSTMAAITLEPVEETVVEF